jgi:hypothetical protein
VESHHIDAYAALRQKIAAYLGKAGYWGSEADILERMQREYQDNSGGEYSYRLSDEFDQSLIYLPGAIEYLGTLPLLNLRDDDYEGNLDWAGRAVAAFLQTWHSDLHDMNLIDDVVAAIQTTLDRWNGIFPSPHAGSPGEETQPVAWTDFVGFPPSGTFLDAILISKVPHQDTSLFESCLPAGHPA